MSLITKQLIINNIVLPSEIIDILKDFVFHKIKKIPKNDERYELLQTIPDKEYNPITNMTYVYINISQYKDYYLVHTNDTLQIQTLGYGDDDDDDDGVYFIDGYIFQI